MSSRKEDTRPVARLPRGLRDSFAGNVVARQRMIDAIRDVYQRYGFAPLETPAIEYLDVLGKQLPDSDTPAGGIFAFRDEDNSWIALRYDLTAPLSRIFAERRIDLPTPFRRYQVGLVWRNERPGPGRFREFYQFDIDTVGAASMAADAEVCCVLADALEALQISRGDYVIRVNNRKALNGVVEVAGLPTDEQTSLTVLRAIDKLDRLGLDGVRQLLGAGRTDESGDFTPGANLTKNQSQLVINLLSVKEDSRVKVCDRLEEIVRGSAIGAEGVVVREGERVTHIPGHRVTPVDATGAGDCFCGSFGAALAAGAAPTAAAEYANAAAAISVTHLGAGVSMPARAEVESFLASR